MRKPLLLLTGLLLLPGLRPPTASAAPLDPRIPSVVQEPLPGDLLGATVHRLKNGLTVYLSPNAQLPRITAWIAVRAGSKHDPAVATGQAHYLEHMLFKGTERLGTLDWNREEPVLDRITALYDRRCAESDPGKREALYAQIDQANQEASAFEVPNELDKLYHRLGFDNVNAYTMDEGTVFQCDFPRNRAEVWAQNEADRFAHPVFRLFQTELEIVYEEKNRGMDNPDRAFDEEVAQRLYPKHPYGIPTLGTIAHLKNPSLSRMYDFFHAHYHPNNMCVALAGDFDRAAMLALLERTLGAWEPAPLPPPATWPVAPPHGVARFSMAFEAEEKVMIAWLAVPRNDPDADAVTVMDMLMDNAVAGIINLSLVQAQKVKAAGSYPELLNDAGAWYTWAVPKRGQTLAQAEALLLGAVEELKSGRFSDDDVRAVITNFEVGEKRKLESDEARVGEMTGSFLGFEEWQRDVAKLDRLRRVTKADVVRVASRLLGGNRVVGWRRNGKPALPSIEKPKFTDIPMDDARQSARFTELANLPAPLIEPKFLVQDRDYRVADRPWGRLYTAPNPLNDVFTLKISFAPYGTRMVKQLAAAFDLADLSGAGTLSAGELRKRFFALGTSVSYNDDERWVGVEMTGLEVHLKESLDLVIRQFTMPNSPPEALPRMVDVAIGAHRDAKRNPERIFGALAAWAQRGPQSRVLNELSDAELKVLTVDGLHQLARGVLDYPRDVRYVGNRSPDELTAILAALPPPVKPRPAKRWITYLTPATTRVMLVHRDMVQAQVLCVSPDGAYDPGHAVDDDFLAQYLGGSMSSVIFQEIREARALAYSAWGGYVEGHWAKDDNRLLGELGCQADKTVEAAGLLADLIRTPPISATRFSETARAIEEGYRTQVVKFRDVPDTVLQWEELGLGTNDPRPQWFKRAQTYTLADLDRFAARFHGRPLTIAILGDRSRINVAGVKTLGAFEEVPLDRIFPY